MIGLLATVAFLLGCYEMADSDVWWHLLNARGHQRAANRARGVPDFTVGDGTVIEGAILDKDCRIGRNVRIVNRRGVQDEEGATYVIRDGIVVIPRGTIIPDGTVI